MNYEYLYDEFIMDNYPESYGGKEGMISNWEQGFAFDHFAQSLNMTEDQLLELI
jgi:hypothetical protein